MRAAAITISLVYSVIGLAFVLVATQRLVRIVRSGQPDTTRGDHVGQRFVTLAREVLGHSRMLKLTLVGIAHWPVMVAFGALFFTLVEAFGELFSSHFRFPLLGRFNVYSLVMEYIALLCGVGILALIAIRQAQRPDKPLRKSRFTGSNFFWAYYIEATIVGIIVCVFLLRGLRVADGTFGYTHANVVSYFLGEHVFGGLSHHTLELALLWTATAKILISFTWFIMIAVNANMGLAWHRFTAFFNIFFKRNADGTVALGPLRKLDVDFEDPGEDDKYGVGVVEDFSWKGLLDFSTCTECGRCQSQCPAWNTGKPLSPKLLIMSLRDHMFAKSPYLLAGEEARENADDASIPASARAEAERPLVGTAEEGGIIDPDVLWSCTTCGACVEQCPVDIEHVDHIVDMRRYQVLLESAFPSEAGTMLKNIENNGNPWGANPKTRTEWTEDLPFEVRILGAGEQIPDDVEYLFWVGCAGAIEDRAKKVTRAFAELLHTADVEFAVLGTNESCTGDPARRLGAEHVFYGQAVQNIEVLNGVGAKKIVTTCPHCFNTIGREYPQFGGNYEVVHHTQLLGRLVAEGKLVPVTAVDEKITYHDPCYLGRHNKVYTPPREVLAAIQGLQSQEMHRCKERGFCCGAGGARMWMEEKLGKRVNVERVDEALELDPDSIVTSCPFCMVMLSDAVTAKKQAGEARDDVQVLDVTQMLARSLTAPVREPALVGAGGGGSDVTGDVTQEPVHPAADDPSQTEVADTPQLSEAAVSGDATGSHDGQAAQDGRGTPTEPIPDAAGNGQGPTQASTGESEPEGRNA
ncbi:MAG TPA: (Fe-S)-binding protein [Frankiaceae bacterium]